ncbi:MAG: GntR family transcriptional regulator [Alcaligenaceae bacterium]|jgi:GntR family transcriptional regulator, carbon starvation induced regulator|nr:GntR family transcriptional regulator [Alcaligenaceae bacterium]
MNVLTDPNLLEPVEAVKSVTLAEQAYRAIKHDIISGALPPGSALRLEFLKNRYQLSFSPLREALNRLHSERLVDAVALKGFRVSPLSLKEMRDAMSTRIFIDCEALKRSIERGNDDWETRVVGSLHTLSLVTRRHGSNNASGVQNPDNASEPNYDQIEHRHLALHQALISACDSEWLLEFSMKLYIQTERYRRPMLVNRYKTDAPRDVSSEHRNLVEATLSRDIPVATQLLAQHYQKTADLIAATLQP